MGVLLCSMGAGSAGAFAGEAPTVAVMPFRDLSGGACAVGEAIRETVTSDLARLAVGLRLVERANLDRVLGELHLQGIERAQLDAATATRVGKLLGASLILAGACQRAGATVRLTARFVRVETGEVIGSSKVDGPETQLLKLQDRVAADLLRAAGIAFRAPTLAPAAERLVQRKRPALKSLRAVELYDRAVVAATDDRRRELLQLAVAADGAFSYAVEDLAALERKLAAMQAKADAARLREVEAARTALATEKDPARAMILVDRILTTLMVARRYHQMIVEARAIIDHPPPSSTEPGAISAADRAAFFLMQAEWMLRDADLVLREGERLLRDVSPTSPMFPMMKQLLEQAIALKRRRDDGATRIAERLAELHTRARWDLCMVGDAYLREDQAREAQRLYRACLAVGGDERNRAAVLSSLVNADTAAGDWAAAKQDVAELAKENPAEAARRQRDLPTDG